eukprot:4250772-Pyramimonas_sp.AAC.1
MTTEEEHYRSGPAFFNFFCRDLPPAPDKRQRPPTNVLPQEDEEEIIVGHAHYFEDKELYISHDERPQVIQRTPPAMRQKIREAHMTGPGPPHVEAVRDQRENALRYVAEFVEDLISALLSNLSRDDGTLDQAREFLRAEFRSDDIPEGFPPQSFKCLKPFVVGVDDPNNPAALGSADFWRPQ